LPEEKEKEKIYIYNQTRFRSPPQSEHSFHPSTSSLSPTPHILRVIAKPQVHRPVTLLRLWCSLDPKEFRQRLGGWKFCLDLCRRLTGVPETQRKTRETSRQKREEELRIRPRSSVAPVNSPRCTETEYRAARVSRLPYAPLPVGS